MLCRNDAITQLQVILNSSADRELWKSIDELSAERDEIIRNILHITCVTSQRLVYVTESCSNWIVYEENACLLNLVNNSNQGK